MNHTEKSLKVDENLNLVATVAPDNATNKTVTWKSSNEDVAIVENGVVTAKKEGTATITVTTVDGNKTATCEITVEETEEQISPESIALNKTSETLDLNGTKEIQLSVTITPNNANVNKGITWTSSDTKVATVDNTGKVTAVGKGTTTITAKTENGKTATCEITVEETEEQISPESIALNKTSETLDLNGTKEIQLSVTITPNNANVNKGITWTSSDTKVATVDNTGKVTAVGKGTTTITAKTENGKTATCEITVEETEEQVSPESIALNKTSETLDLNGTKEIQLSVTITPNNANVNKGITWTSSDTKVATVDNTGKVTAVGKGTTTITAKTENGKTATCEITVKDSGEEDNGNENNNNNNSNDNNKNTENTVSKNDKTEEVPSKLPYTGSLRSIITVVIILIIVSAAFCYIKLKQYKYIK